MEDSSEDKNNNADNGDLLSRKLPKEITQPTDNTAASRTTTDCGESINNIAAKKEDDEATTALPVVPTTTTVVVVAPTDEHQRGLSQKKQQHPDDTCTTTTIGVIENQEEDQSKTTVHQQQNNQDDAGNKQNLSSLASVVADEGKEEEEGADEETPVVTAPIIEEEKQVVSLWQQQQQQQAVVVGTAHHHQQQLQEEEVRQKITTQEVTAGGGGGNIAVQQQQKEEVKQKVNHEEAIAPPQQQIAAAEEVQASANKPVAKPQQQQQIVVADDELNDNDKNGDQQTGATQVSKQISVVQEQQQQQADCPVVVKQTVPQVVASPQQKQSGLLDVKQAVSPHIPPQQTIVQQQQEQQIRQLASKQGTTSQLPPIARQQQVGPQQQQKLVAAEYNKETAAGAATAAVMQEEETELLQTRAAEDDQTQKAKQLALQKAKQQAAEQLALQRARVQSYGRETQQQPLPLSSLPPNIHQAALHQRVLQKETVTGKERQSPHQYALYQHQQQSQFFNNPLNPVSPTTPPLLGLNTTVPSYNNPSILGGTIHNQASTQNKQKRKLSAYVPKNTRVRCNKCPACLRDDCGQCKPCKGKVKFGGSGNNKEACVLRRCSDMQDLTKCIITDDVSRKRRLTDGIGGSGTMPESGYKEPLKKKFFYKYKYMYGQVVPREVRDVCTGCYHNKHNPRKNVKKLNDEPILLCDGIGCNREYHIGCCMPPLTEIPTIENKQLISSGEKNEKDDDMYDEENYDDETAADENHWYCYDCSLYGTTYQLKEYFNSQADKRSKYKSSKNYVEYLLNEQIKLFKEHKDNDADMTKDEGNESVEEVEDATDTVIKDSTYTDGVEDADSASAGKPYSLRRKQSPAEPKYPPSKRRQLRQKQQKEHPKMMVPVSEVWDITQLHHTAIHDFRVKNEESDSSQDNNRKCTKSISSSLQYNVCDEEVALGPDFLVGKPVRLYEPTSNLYHDGRIIDWRRATHLAPVGSRTDLNEEHRFYGISDISESEFLVRFSAGQNYRKQTLYQWLILEEHSMAIGCSLVWGQFQDSVGLTGWKPAQTWLRTSLELIPVVIDADDYGENNHFDQSHHVSYIDINDDYNTHYDFVKNNQQLIKTMTGTNSHANADPPCCALAKILGEESHAVLDLRKKTIGLNSRAFCQRYLAIRKMIKPSKMATTDSVKNDNIAACQSDGVDANQQRSSTTVIAENEVPENDRQLDISIALAVTEAEEQRRLSEWYGMPLKNPVHKNAFSIIDEGGLPPLILEMNDTVGQSPIDINQTLGIEDSDEANIEAGKNELQPPIKSGDDVGRSGPSKTMCRATNNDAVDFEYDDELNTKNAAAGCSSQSGSGFTDPRSFPNRLYTMLRDIDIEGRNTEIVCWASHGKCFKVHDYRGFEEMVLPRYFEETKYSLFQRQLLLYGFVRVEDGPDKGAYYHKNFTRSRSWLQGIIPKINRISSPERGEPDDVIFRCRQMLSYMEEVKNYGPAYQNLQMKGTIRKFLERSRCMDPAARVGVTQKDPMFSLFKKLMAGLGLNTFKSNESVGGQSDAEETVSNSMNSLAPQHNLSKKIAEETGKDDVHSASDNHNATTGASNLTIDKKIANKTSTEHVKKKTKVAETTEMTKANKSTTVLPHLCPLIEQGLDRMSIMNLLDKYFGGVEKSLDTADSLSCSFVKSTPTAMAKIRSEKVG